MKDLFGPKPYDAKLTIPNIITTIGILLLIPYVLCFLTGGNRWVMFGALFLAGCSDLFDGLCARLLKQGTKIGEFIDPLRDRLHCGAVLVNLLCLGGKNLVIWIVIMAVIELMIALTNCYRYYHGGYYLKDAIVHLAGKLRQMAHLLICGLVIISHYFNDVVADLTGLNLAFPLEMALIIMALFSSVALLFYWRLYAD